MSGVEKVVFAITTDFECWMINSLDSRADLAACELFGFGLGSFSEIGAGQVHVMIFFVLACKIQQFSHIQIVSGLICQVLPELLQTGCCHG